MPFLSDFPNEILDELMIFVLAISRPSQLQAFLFSRQFNPSAVRAIYLDVRFMINSDSQVASLKDSKPQKKIAKIRNNLLALDLLASTALQSPHLFEHTHTVELRIFETYSKALSASIGGTGHFSGGHSSDPTFAAIWVDSVASILSAVPAVEHLVCDWFMNMDGVSTRIQQLSRLRTLQLRGTKFVHPDYPEPAKLPNHLVLPAGLEVLRLSLLSFNSEFNFNMASTPLTAPAQLKLDATDSHAWYSESGPDSPTVAMNRARYTEARIVYDEHCLHTGFLDELKHSHNTLETLEFLDGCNCQPDSAKIFYSTWTRFTILRRLSLSIWNVPDPSMASECRLEELTHLQLNMAEEELSTFSTRFEKTLECIEEGKLYPKLESIKLSTRTMHSRPNGDGKKWSALRLLIQSEWSDKGLEKFCGWRKASSSKKDASHHASGIYRFANGIELDVTDILALAKKLEEKSKRKPSASGRLTGEESLKMVLGIKLL